MLWVHGKSPMSDYIMEFLVKRVRDVGMRAGHRRHDGSPGTQKLTLKSPPNFVRGRLFDGMNTDA